MNLVMQSFFDPEGVAAPAYSNALLFSRFGITGSLLKDQAAEAAPLTGKLPESVKQNCFAITSTVFDHLPKLAQTSVVFSRVVSKNAPECPFDLADATQKVFKDASQDFKGELFYHFRIPCNTLINYLFESDSRLEGCDTFGEWFKKHDHPFGADRGRPQVMLCAPNKNGFILDPVQLYNLALFSERAFESQPFKHEYRSNPDELTFNVFCSANDYPEIMELENEA